MLTWTDLCGLLLLAAGPVSGVTAGLQPKAGVLSIILFAAAGLVIAFLIAKTSSKLSYRILDSKKLPGILQFTGYMFLPMVSLLLAILVPVLIVTMIYGKT